MERAWKNGNEECWGVPWGDVAGPRASDACARCGATTDAAWPRSACYPCSRRGAMAESLYIYLWRNKALDVPAATARAQQHLPPGTRPPCAHAPTTHMPEDRRCRFVGGFRVAKRFRQAKLLALVTESSSTGVVTYPTRTLP